MGVGAVATLAALVFVVARLAVAAHGNPAEFVLAGGPNASAKGLPQGVVLHSKGYDGQYYYRLALAPWDLRHRAFGIAFDAPYRLARIGYPFLAWLVSGGGIASAVPVALIAINVASIGALGAEGAVLATDAGHSRWWGLLLPGFFGLVTSLARDTAEPLELALVFAGLILLRRRRPWVAAACFSAAVLSKETALVAVAAVGIVDIARRVRAMGERRGLLRRPERPSPRPTWGDAAAWVAPSATLVGWEGLAWIASGTIPIASDTRYNATIPLEGLRKALVVELAHFRTAAAWVFLAELAVMVLVWVWAIAASSAKPLAGPSRGTVWAERIAFGANLMLALVLPVGVWGHPLGNFRPLADSFAWGVVVALGSRVKLVPLGAGVLATWVMIALLRVFVL